MSEKEKLELLKADPITAAVDAANLLLAPHGVKIEELMNIDPDDDSYIIDGKRYTKETMDAIDKLGEIKYYRASWTDTYDYDDYTTYETEYTLEKAIRLGKNNMQRCNEKVEITKEEYLSHKK